MIATVMQWLRYFCRLEMGHCELCSYLDILDIQRVELGQSLSTLEGILANQPLKSCQEKFRDLSRQSTGVNSDSKPPKSTTRECKVFPPTSWIILRKSTLLNFIVLLLSAFLKRSTSLSFCLCRRFCSVIIDGGYGARIRGVVFTGSLLGAVCGKTSNILKDYAQLRFDDAEMQRLG